MLSTGLPATLPPREVVAALSPAAAKAIGRFDDFAAKLPPRASAEEMNELESRRNAALGELGGEFFERLDDEETKLRETLTGELSKVRTSWGRLEAIAGLRAWQRSPTSFAARARPVMSVRDGGGGQRPIFGREVLAALTDSVTKGV